VFNELTPVYVRLRGRLPLTDSPLTLTVTLLTAQNLRKFKQRLQDLTLSLLGGFAQLTFGQVPLQPAQVL